MKLNIYLILLITALFLGAGSLLPVELAAQTNDICQDKDCPTSLLSIKLPSPSEGAQSPQRTEQYKNAYLKVKQLVKQSEQNADWNGKYAANQLGGSSCLRMYDLEGYFAEEYNQNPGFKVFVDQQESDIKAFKERGFESSRRAINLRRRMQSQCPEQLKEGKEKEKGTKNAFQELGQELGYFDEQGNVLKPFVPPTPSESVEDIESLSKRKQIQHLKEKVSQLPVGPETKNKLSNIKDGLNKAKPKLGLLKGALGLLGSRLGTFLPGPLGLAGKMKTLNDVLNVLKAFKPKLPFAGLLSKVGNLFNRGKKLGDKAKDLVDQSQGLDKKHEKLKDKADGLEKELDKSSKKVKQLEDKLNELAGRKKDLEDKLEDRPRRMLDELHDAVDKVQKEADDLVKEVEKESEKKKELLDQLAQLEQQKQEVEEELAKLEEEKESVEKEVSQLEEEVKEVEQEVEEAKKQEEQLDNLEQQLEELKPEEVLAQELKLCKSDFQKMLDELSGVEDTQGKLKGKLDRLLSRPAGLLDKIKNLRLFHDKLKLGKNGIPVVEKTLDKLNELSYKAGLVGDIAEILTGRENQLQSKVEEIDTKISGARSFYDTRIAELDQLQNELLELVAEKSGLNDKLGQATDGLGSLEQQVNDFINRYTLFDEETDCISLEELRDKINEIKNEQAETESEVEELEEELEEAEAKEEQLEEETQEVEQEIEEKGVQAAELEEEKEALKEEYGKEIELEPVTVEEWSESFEVERPYWDAVFHPDDEVVEGYKGRYFEVRLKDANKAVKLLFGPGEYFMSKNDFREQYGPTIGAFVTEALLALKKSEREKIKVFIQGSADISGQSTFSGNLDDNYRYDAITVLPQKDGGERFLGNPETRQTPTRNFRNDHLPNLRGQYLKEMITVYSKKLEPILLEGSVKKVVDVSDRNAVIYLFIPEELLD